MTDDRRCEVLLALQQALLGEISANLRAVAVSIGPQNVHFRAFFDGSISEGDRESMSFVETELMAALTARDVVSHSVERLDCPAPIPKRDIWVYCRREQLQEGLEPRVVFGDP